jgi:hypothetical protein
MVAQIIDLASEKDPHGCRLPNSEGQSQIFELLAIARAVVPKPLFGHDRRWCVLGAHGTLLREA